jgi:hypothetical protein
MPGFVLGESIEELTYDFTPYAGKGTVAEPSALQIQNFRRALGEMIGTMAPNEEEDVSMYQRVQDFFSRDTTEIQDKILHAAADVCSDHPSFDELAALPYRAQQAFLGWITGTFLVPQQLMPATSS